MNRKLRPLAANVGGVEIIVTTQARRNIRRFARCASVAVGYTAGIAAATMTVVAVAQNVMCIPIVCCAVVASAVMLRCKKEERKEIKK